MINKINDSIEKIAKEKSSKKLEKAQRLHNALIAGGLLVSLGGGYLVNRHISRKYK